VSTDSLGYFVGEGAKVKTIRKDFMAFLKFAFQSTW